MIRSNTNSEIKTFFKIFLLEEIIEKNRHIDFITLPHQSDTF